MTKRLVALRDWVDARFPLLQLWNDHLARYYAPKNFNFWYFFGSLALFILVIQIVTGIWLTMNYKPSAELAFASVEYIMRDVEWGWWIRYMHSTGASAFFIVIYLHMYRAMLYGSYKRPRELLWIIGMLIYFTLMAEAFFGYLLPWGQMSFWGAQVIISLFGALPVIGDDLALWIRGDFVVSDVTLNRFFSLHVIAFPLVLCGLVGAHLIALHEVGSNNPDGVEIKDNKGADGIPLDGVPFHPYYTVKDIVGVVVFLNHLLCGRVFSTRDGRLFSRSEQFCPGRPAEDTGTHSAVVVFHPVLCHPAGHPEPVRRCRRHGRGGAVILSSALAGPESGQVHTLPGLELQNCPGPVHGQLYCPGLAGPAACHHGIHLDCAAFHADLFPVFPVDAVLYRLRQGQTRTGQGDMTGTRVAVSRWGRNSIPSPVILLLLLLPASPCWPAGEGDYTLRADVDLSDRKSLQRGARTFVNYCLSCHSASFMRYNRLGRDLHISEDVLKENFMFGTDKTGDTMTVTLNRREAEKYFGVAPPDLSVTARSRGADWLYTYLMTFYRDPSRPNGVNNLAFEDTAMPHVLWQLQGWQEPVYKEVVHKDNRVTRVIDRLEVMYEPVDKPEPYQDETYEETVMDLVNFMVYLGEPIKLKRKKIGAWTITYLLVLLVLVYLLKREYWRDVR